MTNDLGRLPGTCENTDSELELLELQLITTKNAAEKTKSKNLFPTYPRKRTSTASLMTLWSSRGLLEEGHSEATKRLMLTGINIKWEFNAFALDRLTGGQSLANLCTYLFQDLGLLTTFRLDALVVWRFFAAVERHYHSANPYHNGVHAADVTQAMSCFISQSFFRDHLRPQEKLAAIVAAVGHDLDHPGYNEKFLVATSSHLAGLYNNSSVLENHHWRTCVALMHESGLAKSLNAADLSEVESLIQTMVLATDISRQSDFLRLLGQYLDANGLDMAQSQYRHFMLQIALKCADISNPCRPWNISRLWSYRACEEFYRQGDRERELSMPVTPFCDRTNISVAKVQSTFYRYVAAPLFEEWHRALNTPLSSSMLRNLTSNQARWDLIIQQENRSTMAESVVSTSSSSGGGGSFQCESRRDSLEPPPPNHRLSRSSADGDDDSDPCTSYPYMPLDAPEGGSSIPCPASPRRHSLPPFLSDPLFRLYTSMTSPTKPEVPTMLHRQLSLVDRRRSSAVQELRRQNSELLASLKLAQRRRLFAANRNRASTGSATSTEAETSLPAKVTFHLGASGDADVEEEEDDSLGQNTSMLHVINPSIGVCHSNSKRRGSAPCSLLLSQINRIANSASKAASTASREHSPRGCNSMRGHLGHRRGSLPSDLIELGNPRSHSRSSSGGPSRPAHAHADKSNKKRKLLRRRSSGDSFSTVHVGEQQPHLTTKRRGPALGKQRGSLKSSSFGGVGCGHGVIKPVVSIKAPKKLKGTSESCLYTGRMSWHGNNGKVAEVTAVAEAVNKLSLLRNSHLSPSVESELLEEIRTNHNECNGRRGSLPIELILC